MNIDNTQISVNDALVIIPAYNEESKIKKTIQTVLKYFDNILLIDDGSSDNTNKYIKEFNVPILEHFINLGQGAALETGFRYFLNKDKYKYVITFDADGQHDPLDAIKMLIFAKETKSDAIFGSRFLNKNNLKKIPFLKKLTLRLAIIYESFFYKTSFTDAHNGLRVFSKSIVKNDILPILNYDMAHATEISYKASYSGKLIREYPVKISYDFVKSQSPINAINILVKSFFQIK